MDTNKIESINLVIKFLKEGEILVSKNKILTYFALKKDKVHCQNANSSYNLTIDEFKKLFENSTFYIYSYDNKTFIDSKKDDEYYSWDILKK